MKKTLVAIAALAAATGAMAQSSVTAYGVLDMGVGTINYAKAGSSVTTRSGTQLNGNDTSRWGLTGTEDLGGGTKAEFKIESQIGTNPRSGLAGNSDNANGTTNGTGYTLDTTVVGNRELWVGLVQNNLRVNLGYGVTAMRGLAVQTDAAQSNQYGNQIAHDVGAYRRAGARVDYTSGAWLVSGGVFGNQQSSTAAPAGEFRGSAAAPKGWTLGAQYTQGPINAGYFHDEATIQSPALVAGTDYTMGWQQPAAAAAANTTKKTDLLAGSYDAGVAKLFGQYYSQNAILNDGTDTGVGAGKITGTSIGVRVPFGATTLFAQSFNGKDKRYVVAATGESRNYTGSSFGVRHDLSKRTYAFLNTGSLKKDASVGTTGDDTKYKQTALGIVHAF